MIESFKDPLLEKLLKEERTGGKISQELAKRITRKLLAIKIATDINDLRIPPGNMLEALHGDREGQFSIRVNDQYRLCFTWDDGFAKDVELVDYHRRKSR